MAKHDFALGIKYLVETVDFNDGLGGQDEKVQSITEAVIANAIAKAMYNKYYKTWNGYIMCYSGKKWVKVRTKEDMPKIALEVLRRKKVGIVYQMPSVSEKIKNLIMQDLNLRVYTGSKGYVSFQNCILDLTTMEKLEFSEEFESMIYLDFEYNPEAQCPEWKRVLKEVISDDASIRVLQEFLGLTFIDRNNLNVETMLFLVGTGGNGKGVVYDMIKNILGSNCSSTELSYLCTHNVAEYYRAGVVGKLLNFCSDMGTKDFSNGVFKKMTSHEEVECRQPGGEYFETRDMPLLAASINKMPVITDSTDGFWRRCAFIKFPHTIPADKQDKLLKFKLRAEIPGVFNWIMTGMKCILDQKGIFTHSEAMQEYSLNARIDSNSVLSWCRDNRYRGRIDGLGLKSNEYREMKMFASDMIKSYALYCTENNNMSKSRPNFNEDLKAEGFIYKERMRLGEKVSSGFIFYQILKDEILEKEETDEAVDNLPF